MFSNFNPRTHKECDTWSPAVEDATTGFQSTHHKECDLSLFAFVARRIYFNPRTHKECDRLSTNKQRRLYDFNPRTHKECDAFPIALPNCQEIFQSTHSQRVRPLKSSIMEDQLQISIHALTKSATHRSCQMCQKSTYFNPRTHKECDCWNIKAIRFSNSFQSTHSQRVRPTITSKNIYDFSDFNPRTHKECDPLSMILALPNSLFQSTHSQRVRLNSFGSQVMDALFQSTHSQRVRLLPND